MYKADWAVALAAQIASFVKTEQAWLGVRDDGPAAGRLLDYAGGNGVCVSLVRPLPPASFFFPPPTRRRGSSIRTRREPRCAETRAPES